MSTSILKKPRRKPSPSQRDQELYVLYQTTGMTQDELAEKYRLTQCRVSQIVRRVEKWRAEINPQPHDLTPAGGKTPVEQRRLDRWLERERSEAIIKQALRNSERPQQVKTTKTGPNGEEVTIRELPTSPQWLRLAQRANEQLFRRDALAPLPEERPDHDLRQQIMHEELVQLCINAVGRRILSRKPHAYTLVDQLLQLLRGEPLNTEFGIDPGLGELSRLLAKKAAGDAAAESMAEENMAEEDVAKEDVTEEGADEEGAWRSADARYGESEADAISSTCAESGESPQVEAEEHLAVDSPGQGDNSEPPEGMDEKRRQFLERMTTESSSRRMRERARQLLREMQQKTQQREKAEREADEKAERHRIHMENLEKLKEAHRRGESYSFVFDSEDGPLPPPYYRLDGVDCK
jgi:hypothetical protein